MLLGLDMMTRHHCLIDLKQGIITFGSQNVSTEFHKENSQLHVKNERDQLAQVLAETYNMNQEEVFGILKSFDFDYEKTQKELDKRKK